jgi:hypothetical protein
MQKIIEEEMVEKNDLRLSQISFAKIVEILNFVIVL